MSQFLFQQPYSSPNIKKTLFFIVWIIMSWNVIGQPLTIKNGVNIQASYYNNGRVAIGWDLMKEYPAIQAVRIEIEPERASQAVRWIREAHQNGYQVIATYHESTQLGSNKIEHLQEAANWWVRNYQQFTTNGPIIINLMNEWGGHELSPIEYANAYNEAIATVRKVHEGPLIIDVPGFGHDIEIAADAYSLIEDKQIIYSLHVYPSAINVQKDSWITTADLDYLIDSGAPCMIGEFGAKGNGGTEWCRIVEYAYQQGWAIFGWAWNGDGRSMNMASPSWLEQPRATSFEPTPYLEEIVASLEGIPCYTQVFGNSPNQPCEQGAACNDNNDFTIKDEINEYCVCIGIFTDALSTSIEPSIFLYPNPVTQNVTIELIKIGRVNRVEIYNYTGQLMISQEWSTIQKVLEVNVINLPIGGYFAVLKMDNKKVFSEKFIKL